MNIVAINRKPQSLLTIVCPICRKQAHVVGRVAPPKDGRVKVLLGCHGCGFYGEHEIDVPNGAPA